jgi:hypothetical protein
MRQEDLIYRLVNVKGKMRNNRSLYKLKYTKYILKNI